MSKMIMGAFHDSHDVDAAVTALEEHGISSDHLSIITAKDHADNTAGDKVADTVGGATSGAVTGGMIGGLAGLLAGVGIVPAIAGLFIGGPIAAALGATGVAAAAISGAATGAAAGGLIGALTNLGLPEETAKSYDTIVSNGGYLLAVSVHDGQEDAVRQAMEDNGATDLHEVDTDHHPAH